MYVGVPGVLWAWPLLVVGVVLATPALRARLRRPPTRAHVGAITLTGLLAGAGVVMLWSTYLRAQPVPTRGGSFYPDLMFHLGITRNLQIEAWPSDPQVAGNVLNYHWFADSHIASVGLATGVDASALVFHLWLVPMLLLTAALLSALARQCVETWWVGPALVWLSLVGTSALLVDQRLSIGVTNVVTPLSPSQVLAAPVFLALASLLVDFLRGQRGLAEWLAVLVVSLTASGTKPTVLPVIAAGLAVGLVVRWLMVRRVDRGALGMLLLTAGVLLTTQGVLVGSTGGSSLRFLGFLRAWGVYDELTGDTSLPGSGGFLLDPFTTASGAAAVAGLMVAFLTAQWLRLVGLLTLLRPRLRADAAVPFLAGAGAASWAGLLLLDHPGVSEYYFLYTGVPVLTLLTLWLLVDLGLPGPAPRWLPAAAVGLMGGLVLVALGTEGTASPGRVWLWVGLSVLGVVLAAVLAARLMAARVPARREPGECLHVRRDDARRTLRDDPPAVDLDRGVRPSRGLGASRRRRRARPDCRGGGGRPLAGRPCRRG